MELIGKGVAVETGKQIGNDFLQWRSCDSPEMFSRVTVLVKNNKSLELIPENSSPVFSSAFLIIFLLLGIFLNVCVFFVTFFSSVKNQSFNRLVACFSVTLTLECVINISSSVIFHSSWEELFTLHEENSVKLFCSLNATSLQFVAVMEMYFLTLISYERWVVSRGTGSEDDGVKLRMVIPWIIVGAGVASLPVRLLPTRFVEQRYSCSPVYVSSKPIRVLTGVLVILIGFCFPLVIILNAWRSITTNSLRERRRVDSLTLPLSYNPPQQPPHNTLYNTLAGVLVILFFLLVVPNIIYVQTTQFLLSYDSKSLTNGLLERFIGNRTELPDELKPIKTSVFDTVCVWVRYSFTVISPGVVILYHKQIREEIGKIFTNKQTIGRRKKRKTEEEKEVSWKVPVLFATSEGLHLRIPQSDTTEPKFTIKFCDLETTREKKSECVGVRGCRVLKEIGRERRKMSVRRFSDLEGRQQNEMKKIKESDGELLNESNTSLLLTLHQRIRQRDV